MLPWPNVIAIVGGAGLCGWLGWWMIERALPKRSAVDMPCFSDMGEHERQVYLDWARVYDPNAAWRTLPSGEVALVFHWYRGAAVRHPYFIMSPQELRVWTEV